jgi:hypothetical protein
MVSQNLAHALCCCAHVPLGQANEEAPGARSALVAPSGGAESSTGTLGSSFKVAGLSTARERSLPAAPGPGPKEDPPAEGLSHALALEPR